MSLCRIVLFCLLANCIHGQEQNPFDISVQNQHESQADIVKEAVDLDTIDNNPFSIANTIAPRPQQDHQKPEHSAIPVRNKTDRYTPLSLAITGISLILMVLGINSNRSRFNRFLKSLVNTNQLKSLGRSEKGLISVQDLALYLVFALNLSMLIYMILNNYLSTTARISWFYLLVIVMGVYMIRHLIQRIMSYIFTFTKVSNLHSYSVMVHNICAGVLLFPILLGLQFGPASFYSFFFITGASIVMLVYMVRQGKGLLFALGIRGFNLMYFFIYLCAVELAPVVILIKGLSQYA